jgi:hypothetical protein
MPGWSLAGTEQSDATRAIVERIPRVEALHTGALANIPGTFDVISLTHVLEHIARPSELLRTAAGKLRPRGTLFVQVPDARSNPFDLLIADHISHFTTATATALMESAGFAVCASGAWVVKEVSLVCRPSSAPPASAPAAERGAVAGLDWLVSVRDAARAARAAATGPFALFGSSIAATWLAQEVGGAMQFFVDEDPSRQGKPFSGRPVVSPADVPPGSTVFVGIGGGVADQVVSRLTRTIPSVVWVAAPPLM